MEFRKHSDGQPLENVFKLWETTCKTEETYSLQCWGKQVKVLPKL